MKSNKITKKRADGNAECQMPNVKLKAGLPFGIWHLAFGIGLAFLLATTVYAQSANPPTTAPADNELLKPRQEVPGYGEESYRIVDRKDEIISVLRNGITVIAKRVPSPAVSVRGYALTGGVYEGKWLGGGLSHLLEHLVAGGSNQRRSEKDNKALLQKIGNDSNAYTTTDHTCFFINTTTEHFDQAVDLVTGWMLGALITPDEYRREYQVVQRELERNKGNPDYVFYQLCNFSRYRVSPARIPVIGYQEVIQGLSRDDVYSYYQLAYQPQNVVFAVAGDLDPEKLLATVRHYVDEPKPGRIFSHDVAEEPPVLASRSVVATFPKLGQARLALAYPSVKETHPDMYPLDVLAVILGDGESSILTQEIRDQLQLVNGIGAGDETPAYVDGTFLIEAQLDAANIPAATKAILAEIEKVKANGIDQARLDRAKVQVKSAHLKELQKSEDIAAALATNFFATGDAHFADRYVDRMAAVTAQQVQDAARRYLDAGRLITTALIPREDVGAEGLPKAEGLLRPASPETRPGEVAAQAASKITRIVLGNGLVVLHKRITTTPLVQIGMFALGGATAEDAATTGTGHLAMTLVRRGTAKRSANDIAEFFDGIGGDLSASCGNNTWLWTASCTRDDLDKTMEVYADVVNNPAFPEPQVAAFKQRTLAAIESQDSHWDAQAFRFFKSKFYGPKNSPYQFNALGSKEVVSKLTADDLKKWYQGKVLAAPRALAIFGDVDPQTATAMAAKYFGQGSQLPPPPVQDQSALPAGAIAPADVPAIAIDRVEVQKTEHEVAGVVIGFDDGATVADSQRFTRDVAQCLTGGYAYPTGYIFEILRGQGLVYEAATINQPGRSQEFPGAFIVYGGCDPANVNKVVDIMLENIARLQGKDSDILPDWFARSKPLITTSQALQNETPEAQAMQVGLDELFGIGYDAHEKFAENINAVSLPDVQQLARTHLRHCVVTICTPAPQSVSVKAGEKQYTSFPPVDLTPRGIQHDVVPGR